MRMRVELLSALPQELGVAAHAYGLYLSRSLENGIIFDTGDFDLDIFNAIYCPAIWAGIYILRPHLWGGIDGGRV